jgi:hypothetical protein
MKTPHIVPQLLEPSVAACGVRSVDSGVGVVPPSGDRVVTGVETTVTEVARIVRVSDVFASR